MFTIRLLRGDDDPVCEALRRRALTEEPHAFLMTPEEHALSTPEERRARLEPAPDGRSAVFGAFVRDPSADPGAAVERLVGMVGIVRFLREKQLHTMHLWGTYTAPEHRGKGIARALLDAALAHARSVPGVERVTLGVVETQTVARRLYESAGFVPWGTEPDAFRVGGRDLAETHLVLPLRHRSSAGFPGAPAPTP